MHQASVCAGPPTPGTNAVPNKPMVPTATTFTEERSRNLGRQHIGEPFDAERRA